VEGSNKQVTIKSYYVYILRNQAGTFYTGVTNNLPRRVFQHKHKVAHSFISKYNIDKLIYFEEYNNIEEAVVREKQIKNWNRKKKVNLIIQKNPTLKEMFC
jgi:putative endonuclease